MKLKNIFVIVLFLGFSFAEQMGQLKVILKDVRDTGGKIYISVHQQQSSFPMKSEKALTNNMLEGKERVSVFNGLSYGEYAVSVFHDENDNKKMDTHFFGIPKEGVGASNNKMGFGPPSFKDSAFMLNETEKTITIDVKYL